METSKNDPERQSESPKLQQLEENKALLLHKRKLISIRQRALNTYLDSAKAATVSFDALKNVLVLYAEEYERCSEEMEKTDQDMKMLMVELEKELNLYPPVPARQVRGLDVWLVAEEESLVTLKLTYGTPISRLEAYDDIVCSCCQSRLETSV